MKFNNFIKAMSLVILTVPLFSCAPNSANINNNEQPQIEKIDNDMLYEIYQKMISNDYFSGTYEEFLEFIKGEQGDDGKDGQDGVNGFDGLVPFIGENGNWWIGVFDTKIPAKGEIGDDGKPGEDGSPSTTTYQYYKQRYGYMGSETDFIYDLNHHHLGTDKKHNVSIIKWVYDEKDHYYTEEVLNDTVFKNGENIDFSQYTTPEYRSLFTFANDNNKTIEMLDSVSDNKPFFESYLMNDNFDIDNYRAYKDVTIVLFYDLYTLSVYPNKDELLSEDSHDMSCDINKTIHLNFSLTGTLFNQTINDLPKDEVNFIKLKVGYDVYTDDNQSIIFDAKEFTLRCIDPNIESITCKIYVAYSNFICEESIVLAKKLNPRRRTAHLVTNDIKENLYNLSINESFVFDMYVCVKMTSYYREYKYTWDDIDKSDYTFKLKNDSKIIDMYDKTIITGIKTGEDILQIFNNGALIEELPVRVLENSDFKLFRPFYNIDIDYSRLNPEKIATGIAYPYLDETNNSDLHNADVGILDLYDYHEQIDKTLFNDYLTIDANKNTITFHKSGNFRIILYDKENHKCLNYWISVKVIDREHLYINIDFNYELEYEYRDIKFNFVNYDEKTNSIEMKGSFKSGTYHPESEYILIDYSAYPELNKTNKIFITSKAFSKYESLEPLDVDVGLNKKIYKNTYLNDLIISILNIDEIR